MAKERKYTGGEKCQEEMELGLRAEEDGVVAEVCAVRVWDRAAAE